MGDVVRITPRGHYLAHEVGSLAGVSGDRVGQWARRGYIKASQSRAGDSPPRAATYVKQRGRAARSVADLGLRRSTDPELLNELSKRQGLGDWVLVTGNDGMPAEHPGLFARLRPTVATIDPRRPSGVTELSRRMDVLHRWAHQMQEQQPGTVRRYSLRANRLWTIRKRHERLA